MNLAESLRHATFALSRLYGETLECVLQQCFAAGLEPARLLYPDPSTIPANATNYVIVTNREGRSLARVWIDAPTFAQAPVFTVRHEFDVDIGSQPARSGGEG